MVSISKKFAHSFAWNFIGKNFDIVFGILVSIVVARTLGTIYFGLYATVLSVINIIPRFISFGFEQLVNVYVPKFYIHEEDRGKIPFLVQELIKIRLAVLFVVGFGLFFFSPVVSRYLGYPELIFYLRLAICILFLREIATIIGTIYPAILNVKPKVIFNSILSMIAPLLTIWVVYMGFGINGLMAVSIFIAALILLFYLVSLRKLLFIPAKPFNIKPILGAGVIIWLASLFSFALGKDIDIVILNLFRLPMEQIGFYSLAFTWSLKMSVLTVGVGALAQSVFSMAYKRGGISELKLSWELVLKAGIFFVLPVAFFFFIYAPDAFNLFYTKAYAPAVPLFRLYLLLIFFTLFTGRSFNGPVLYTLGMPQINLYLSIGVGLANVILDFIFIYFWGVLGAVAATFLSASVFSFVGMGIVRSKIGIMPPILYYAKLMMITFLAVLPTLFFPTGNLIGLFLKAVVYGLLLLMFVRIFRLFNQKEKQIVMRVSPVFEKILVHF